MKKEQQSSSQSDETATRKWNSIIIFKYVFILTDHLREKLFLVIFWVNTRKRKHHDIYSSTFLWLPLEYLFRWKKSFPTRLQGGKKKWRVNIWSFSPAIRHVNGCYIRLSVFCLKQVCAGPPQLSFFFKVSHLSKVGKENQIAACLIWRGDRKLWTFIFEQVKVQAVDTRSP